MSVGPNSIFSADRWAANVPDPAVLPTVFGTSRVSGRVVTNWDFGALEDGGTPTGTPNATVRMAFCQGPAGYWRLWRDGKLIPTATSELDPQGLTYHNSQSLVTWWDPAVDAPRAAYNLLTEHADRSFAWYAGDFSEPEWTYNGRPTTGRWDWNFWGTRATWVPGAGRTHPYPPDRTKEPRPPLGGVAHFRAVRWSTPSGDTPASITAEIRGLHRSGGASPASYTEANPTATDLADDANAADVLNTLINSTVHGLGLGITVETDVGADGTAASSYRRYCQAAGFYVSRTIDGKAPVAGLVKELLQATNSIAFWSEGRLKVRPLGDQPITAYGATYTPYTVAVAIGHDDLAKGDNPVRCEPVAEEDIFNSWPVEFAARENFIEPYATMRVEVTIQGDAVGSGLKRAPVTTNGWISRARHAQAYSQLLGSRSVYQRNRYKFTLGPRHTLLEPGDFLSITEPVFGLSGALTRVVAIEEADQGRFDVTAVEWPGLTTAIFLVPQQSPPDGGSQGPRYVAQTASATATAAQSTATAAQSAATAAQSAAAAAQSTANVAFSLANGKNKVRTSPAPPASPVADDLWISSDTTTACPDANCKGHPADASGNPRVGVFPHRQLFWPHRYVAGATGWVDAGGQRQVIASELVAGSVYAAMIAGNQLKTPNYAFTGTEGGADEVATAGAKMQNAPGGTALVVAAQNVKVGPNTLEQMFAIMAASNWGPLNAMPAVVGGFIGITENTANGRLCAVGYAVATSDNAGRTWTSRTAPGGSYRSVVCGGPAGFVAVGDTGLCATSPDGITWTARTIGAGVSSLKVTWNGTYYLAVGNSSGAGVVSRSTDGITWTVFGLPGTPFGGSYGLAWSGSVFVAVGASGRVATSSDGAMWTARSTGDTNTYAHVAWSPTLGLFSMVSSGIAYTSPDGIAWTRTAGVPSHVLTAGSSDMTWGGLVFVCTGAHPATLDDQVLISADGKTWRVVDTAMDAYHRGICWSFGASGTRNRFVLVCLPTTATNSPLCATSAIFKP